MKFKIDQFYIINKILYYWLPDIMKINVNNNKIISRFDFITF